MLGALGALVTTPFVALTVNVYGVPAESPVTTNGDEAPDAVSPPGEDVAVYEVTAGVAVTPVKDMVACPVPAVAVTPVGETKVGHVPAATASVACDVVQIPPYWM